MTIRPTLAAATLALAAAAALPALAASPHRDINAAVDAMPHSEAVSQGTPVQIGVGEHGTPRFIHVGEPQGNLSAGVPHVVGQNGRTPVIVYTPEGQ